MRRLPTLFVLMAAVAFVSACSEDTTGPTPPPPAGPLTYSLEAIDVTPIPFSLSGSNDGTLLQGSIDGLIGMRRSGAWEYQAIEFPLNSGGGIELLAEQMGGAYVLDADHAWATGNEVVYTYTFGEWETTYLPDTNAGGNAIFAFSPDDVWIAGLRSVMHFDGTLWSPVEVPLGTVIRGMRGAPDGTLFVVGDDGVVLRSSGDQLFSLDSGVTTRLRDVFPVSAGRALFVGDDGLSLRFEGGTMTPLTTGVSGRITAIDGTSFSSVYAAGSGGVFLRFDGTSWQTMPDHPAAQVTGIHAPRGDEIYISTIEEAVLRFDGQAWNPEPADALSGIVSYRAAFALPNGTAWLVGGGRGSGQITTVQAGQTEFQFVPELNTVTAIWASSANDAWAWGNKGEFRRFLHFDGSNWDLVPSPIDGDVLDMWGSAANDVFAVGRDGAIAHFDGSLWQTMVSGTTIDLIGVMGKGPDEVWAIGSTGVLLEYDGTNWVDIASPSPNGFSDLWADDRGLVLLGSSSLFVQNETGFEELPHGPGVSVRKIWRSVQGNFFGASFGGQLSRRVDGVWEELTASRLSATNLSAFYGVSEREVYAGGGFLALRANGR